MGFQLHVCSFHPHRAYNLYATDIMQTQLDYVSYQSTYHELNDLLQTTNHESYPLVDAPGEWEPHVVIHISEHLNKGHLRD